MGMRKKIRLMWKKDRQVNLADQRKAKAIRLTKAGSTTTKVGSKASAAKI